MIIKAVPLGREQNRNDMAKLIRYAMAEREKDEGKAVPEYVGASGFGPGGDGRADRQMLLLERLVRENRACIKPLMHFVLSWAEGRRPSPVQVRQAVDILAAETGMAELPMLWEAHGNTRCFHVHLIVCRIDPCTGRARDLKLYKRACQRAVARINAAQEMTGCKEDLYVVDGSGSLVKNPERGRSGTAPGLSGRAQGLERRTGGRSAQSLAQERVPEALAKAGTWQEFHVALAAEGLAVQPRKSGLVYGMADVWVKASNVGRAYMRPELEMRFGPWEPAGTDVSAPAERRETAPAKGLDGMEIRWKEYRREHEAWKAERVRRREVRAARRRVQEEFRAKRAEARRLVRENRAGLPAGTERAFMMALADLERRKLAALPKRKAKPFPKDFAAWLDAHGERGLAERWRRRRDDGTMPPEMPEAETVPAGVGSGAA